MAKGKKAALYIVLDGKQNVKKVFPDQREAQDYADRLRGLSQVCRIDTTVKNGKLTVDCRTAWVKGALRR